MCNWYDNNTNAVITIIPLAVVVLVVVKIISVIMVLSWWVSIVRGTMMMMHRW